MKRLLIIAVLLLTACTTTTTPEPQPVPTYVIKVWVTDDPKREVEYQFQNPHINEGRLTPSVTPSTLYTNADKALSHMVESIDGDSLDGELRFQYLDKDELIGTWENGQRLTFKAPARSE